LAMYITSKPAQARQSGSTENDASQAAMHEMSDASWAVEALR